MTDLKRTLDANGHCVLEMPSGTGKTVSLLSLIVSYQKVRLLPSSSSSFLLSFATRTSADSHLHSHPWLLQFHPASRKLIYCSRTVPEIEKALAELKRLMEYRARYNVPQGEESEVVKNEASGSNGAGDYDIDMKGKGKAGSQMEDILALGLSSRKNLCIHPSVGRERKGKVVDARCRDMTSAWACEKGRQDPGSVELCDFHEVGASPLSLLFLYPSPQAQLVRYT